MTMPEPVTLHCLADICLIPIGTASPSVSKYIALVEQRIRSCDQVKSTLHSAGTTIEGEWDTVMNLIGQLHQVCHENGVLRVQSDIRVGTRIDKSQTAADKVEVVEERLLNNRF